MVFRQIRSLNGNFSGIWNHVSRDATWTRIPAGKFGRNRSKKSGRSGASFTWQKINASATHFLALSPKPTERFRWKRARLSLFMPQPRLPSFIQIHPSFRDLLAKTTFQIVTIIGDPIGIGSLIKIKTRYMSNCQCHTGVIVSFTYLFYITGLHDQVVLRTITTYTESTNYITRLAYN